MEYFFYCRDNPGTGALRKQSEEEHWTFMDAYASGFVARGPTMTDDGTAQNGSMHIVDLPDAAAARRFAYEEPRYKAGLYGEVIVRRFQNELGRDMWSFKGDAGKNQRFLIIARGKPGADPRATLQDARRQYHARNGYENSLIAGGSLLSDDGSQWMGSVLMVELRDRAAVDAMLAGDPWVQAGSYEDIATQRWRFGGRQHLR